jgi:hypothetical protein
MKERITLPSTEAGHLWINVDDDVYEPGYDNDFARLYAQYGESVSSTSWMDNEEYSVDLDDIVT